MKAPRVGGSLSAHTLRRILENQGPDAAKAVLESFGPPGEHLRQHIKTCADCANVKRELYGDRDIPVNNDYLTAELLELLRDASG